MTPVQDLQARWTERDARYSKGPGLVLTDAQVEVIRAGRVLEAQSVGAPTTMETQARYWTPPPFMALGGRAR